MTSAPETDDAEPARSWLGVATAVGVGVVGIATVIAALNLGLWVKLGPGPGFFPLWLGIILIAASIPWGLRQWRGAEADTVDAGEETNRPWRIAAMAASIVVAAFLLEPLGFQLTMLLFVFFHLRVLHRVRWLVAIPVILAGSFGVFGLFDFLLEVHLPTSAIPFLAAIGL